MGIDSSKFKHYLSLFEKKMGKDLSSETSLYKLKNEFQLFLKNETDVNVDELSLSIDSLLTDNIVELMKAYDDAFQEATDNLNSDDNSNGTNFLMTFLSQLFKDQDLFDSVDLDQNGTIDEKEYKNFFKQIDSDGDNKLTFGEIFSGLEKIKTSPVMTESNTNTDNTNADTNTDKTTFASNTSTNSDNTTNTNPTNTNSKTDKKTSSNTVKNTKNDTSQETVKSLGDVTAEKEKLVSEKEGLISEKNNMVSKKEGLVAKKAEKQTELTSANEKLQAVNNGSNEAVAAAKVEVDNKKEAYDKAVEEDKETSDELKQEKADNDTAISDKESEITEKNTAISEKDTAISNKATEISNKEVEIAGIESIITTTKGQLSEVSATISSNEATINGLKQAKNTWSFRLGIDNEEIKSQAKAKISELESKISKVEEEKQANIQKRDELNKKLDEQNANLQTANDEKTSLIQQKTELETEKTKLEGEKDELESQKAELEAKKAEIEEKILANCGEEVKTALAEYQEAMDSLTAITEQEKTKAQTEVDKVQGEMDEIQTEIDSLQADIEQKETEITAKQAEIDSLTQEEAKLENSAERRILVPATSSTLAYEILMPKDYDPDKEYNLYSFLPGKAQLDGGVKALSYDTNPIEVICKSNLESPDDTIVVTYLTGGKGYGQVIGKFKNTVDSLKSGYNTGKSILAGASTGSAGVSYMAISLGTEYFDKLDFVAGDTNGTSQMKKLVQIFGKENLYAHFGSNDPSISRKKLIEHYGFLPENIYEYENTGHGDIIVSMINTDNQDSSGREKSDGKSDYLENFLNDVNA